MSKKKQEAAAVRKAVWAGLEKHYGAEISEIHTQQSRDLQVFGRIQPETEAKLDALMDRVVKDNKNREGSKIEFTK